MRTGDRAALQRALRQRYSWVDDPELGPRNVEAGECDGCGVEARLVMTCGPGPERYLGVRCAQQRGEQAWCAGHADDARAALAWVARLPEEADTVARLWWVASGEIALDSGLVDRARRRLGLPA